MKVTIEGEDPIQLAMLIRGITSAKPAEAKAESKPPAGKVWYECKLLRTDNGFDLVKCGDDIYGVYAEGKLQWTGTSETEAYQRLGAFVNPLDAAEPLKFQWHWPSKHIAQVGDETFVWFDESGLPRGAACTVSGAQNQLENYIASINNPPIRTVDCETLQENDTLELSLYGDCLHVLYKEGVPFWCGHSETEGRDLAQRINDGAHIDLVVRELLLASDEYRLDLVRYADCLYVVYQDGLVVWSGTEEKHARSSFSNRLKLLTDLAVAVPAGMPTVDPYQPHIKEPEVLASVPTGTSADMPAEPTPVGEQQPADESGYYWPVGTACQYADCNMPLNDYGRRRKNGYCSTHRHSK